MRTENLVALVVIALIFIGMGVALKDEYQKQLLISGSKIDALLNSIKEYLVKDIVATLVRIIFVAPFAVFVIGGFVGLLFLGWGELFRLIS